MLFCLNTQAQTTQDTINKPYWKDMMSNFNVNYYATKRAYDLYFSNKPKVKGTGWKQYERWAEKWGKVINKDGTFPPADKVEKAIKKFNSKNLSLRTQFGSWVSVGPSSEPGKGKWAGGDMSSAGTGRINVLAIHPTNSDIMYAGVPQGGLWKTTNAGVSWSQVSGMSNAQGISTIALFPDDANRILVGTGDRDGGDAQGRGLWISTNGGTSFSQISIAGVTGNGFNFTINKIIVNPLNSSSLMATSSSCVLKSLDKGTTWTYDRLNESFLDIAYAPNDTNTVYMTGNKNSSTTDSFYLSTNGGTSFSTSMSGITVTGIYRSFLATTPANPNIVYLLRVNSAPMEGLYKSSNKGASWTKVLDVSTFNLMGYEANGSDASGGQSFFNVAIYADNLDSNKITVGGVNLYQSTNGGTSWVAKTCWNGCNSLPITHSDVHYITKNTNNNAYFICNDGGLYRTMDFNTFTPIYDGMVISQFYDIDVTAAENGKLVGGLQDNSMVERKNGAWLTHLGGDGMFAEVSDFDPNLMVGSSQNGGLEMTKDGFASASIRIGNGNGYGINEQGPWVTPFQMSPFNDNIFVAGFTSKVFYTKTLRSIDPNNKDANTFIPLTISGEGTAVRFSAKDSNLCFVGTKTGNIYKINNLANGSTPTISQLTSPNAGGFAINDIETSSKDANILWVVLDSMVYKSTDGGYSWTNITGNLPTIKKFSIVVDKFSIHDRLYVGTESGVYSNAISNSLTNDASWQTYAANVPQYTHIRDLEIWYDTTCSSNTSLYAGTYGRGVWKSDLYAAEFTNFSIFGTTTPALNTNVNYTVSWPAGLITTKANWSVTPMTGVSFANNKQDSAIAPITFTNVGTYTIKVKAFNNFGGYCTKTLSVTVGTPPTITVKVTSSSTDNKICVGDSVTLTATGGVSYTISPTTNATKINDSTFRVKPTSTTLYKITGTGSAGQTAYDSVKIISNAVTQVTVNPSAASIVSGNSVSVTASGGISYKWTPTTFLTSPSTGATITTKPTASTVYTVEGTDIHGCKSTATSNITITTAPLNVSLTSTSPNYICKGTKITLNAHGATSYTLNPMTNVVKIDDSTFECTPTVQTTYTVTGTTGSTSGTASITKYVNPLPIVTISPAVKTITSGSNTILTASSSYAGTSSYEWTPNSFIVSGQNFANLTVAPTVNTTYTVKGTDGNGCVGTNTANVIVASGTIKVKMTKNLSSDSICKGQTMTITARQDFTGVSQINQTPTKVNYSISPMTKVTKINDTTFELTPDATIKYYLTGIDENNKTGIDSVNITVIALPTVAVSPASAYVQLGNSATFTASGGGTYTWSPSAYVTSDTVSAALTFTPTNFIDYEVEVENANGCVDYMNVAVGVYTLRTISDSACKSYTWGDNTYTTSGTYSDTFEASSGIDSIVTLNLIIKQYVNGRNITATACKSYVWNTKTYTATGTYQDTVVNISGCDSIHTLNLTIQNTPIIAPVATITSTTSPYLWRGKYYNTSGTYKDTVVNSTSCDSIFELRLTIVNGKLPAIVVPSSMTSCDSFVWRGKVYKSTGTYVDTVINSVRDTIYQLVVTIDNADASVTYVNGEFVSGCVGCTYQWYLCNGGVSNTTLIVNATSRTFRTTTEGDYMVEVKKGSCTGKSKCVNRYSVAIGSQYGVNIVVYPNPVEDKVNISMNKVYSKLEVSLIDNNGKVVYRNDFNLVQNLTLDMQTYSKGMYILQLNDGNHSVETVKLIKE